ncbi:hypothetical protein RvY_14134, partial [Ramazzottius varieornatus]
LNPRPALYATNSLKWHGAFLLVYLHHMWLEQDPHLLCCLKLVSLSRRTIFFCSVYKTVLVTGRLQSHC